MIRTSLTPRAGWQQQFESLGFSYHSIDGLYWDERYAYCFNSEQIDVLEQATLDLHQMSLQAVDHVVRHGMQDRFAIPAQFWSLVEESWREKEFSLYGRFDLSWDGSGAPKMLEYNADTPTGLVESSVAQWYWLQDVFPDADQFNSLHEKLITQWKKFPAKAYSTSPVRRKKRMKVTFPIFVTPLSRRALQRNNVQLSSWAGIRNKVYL
jgi:glutathionylspermidine synthase